MSTPAKKSYPPPIKEDTVIEITPAGSDVPTYENKDRYGFMDLIGPVKYDPSDLFSPFKTPEKGSIPTMANNEENMIVAKHLILLANELEQVEALWPFTRKEEKARQQEKKSEEQKKKEMAKQEKSARKAVQLSYFSQEHKNLRGKTDQISKQQATIKKQFEALKVNYEALLEKMKNQARLVKFNLIPVYNTDDAIVENIIQKLKEVESNISSLNQSIWGDNGAFRSLELLDDENRWKNPQAESTTTPSTPAEPATTSKPQPEPRVL